MAAEHVEPTVPLRRRVSSALGAAALAPASALFCLLPRAWAHWLGRRAGGLAYFVSARSRRTAIENLRLRLGLDDAAARRTAMVVMGQAGASIVDMLRAPRVTDRVLARDIEIPPETGAILDGIRASPRGAVVAIGHFGSWELLFLAGPFLARRPGLIVVRPPPYPLVARLLRWLRSRTGQTVVYRRGAVARSLDFVRSGGVAWLMCDVTVPPRSAQRVDLLGLKTCTTFAPGHIAVTAGVPLFFGYLLPAGWHRYRMMMERIEAPAGLAPEDAARALTERISQALERAIRGCPQGWAWWLKRWNVRPAGVREGWPSYSADERHYLPGGQVTPDPEV